MIGKSVLFSFELKREDRTVLVAQFEGVIMDKVIIKSDDYYLIRETVTSKARTVKPEKIIQFINT